MNVVNPTRVTGRRAWSVAEVCVQLGVSRNFLLGQIRKGQLPARRLSKRIVILTQDLDAYLNNAEQVSKSGEQQAEVCT